MSSLSDTPTTDTPPALTLEQILRGQEGDIILSEPGKEPSNITAYTARQKIGVYVVEEISMMLYPGDPVLVYRQGRLVWRVPLSLNTPRTGPLGWVGVLDIDAKNCRIYITPEIKHEIETHAAAVAARTSHLTAR